MLNANPRRSPQTNPGFARVFQPGRLSLGLMFPIEAFDGDTPTMQHQVELARSAEAAGFAALGFRDVPLRDPGFGDVGQIYDPWVFLGYIAAHTSRIALLTTSIILPLRHPIHTAKAAASVDRLSDGRLLLGVASGDRAIEFPAFGADRDARGEAFREQVALLKRYWGEDFPATSSRYGELAGADVVPKPVAARVPLLVTGFSQSTPEWIAANADGWLTYPRSVEQQARLAADWRQICANVAPGCFRPFAQSYYIDLADNPDQPASAIHLGHRLGRRALRGMLEALREAGVNHVVFNLKYGKRPAREVVEELAEFIVPSFRTEE